VQRTRNRSHGALALLLGVLVLGLLVAHWSPDTRPGYARLDHSLTLFATWRRADVPDAAMDQVTITYTIGSGSSPKPVPQPIPSKVSTDKKWRVWELHTIYNGGSPVILTISTLPGHPEAGLSCLILVDNRRVDGRPGLGTAVCKHNSP
jgi:hypothetical protein